MRSILLVAACLACTHARRMQTPKSSEEDPSQKLKSLVQHLLAGNPALQRRPVRSSTPAMQMQSRLPIATNPNQVPMHKNVDKSKVVLVQGASLKTWAYTVNPDRAQVVLSTDGRPLEADIHLWEGPDNTPTKMRVYTEDGKLRPISTVIETPDKGASTIAVYNKGQVEFPLAAYVVSNNVDLPYADFAETSTIVQGGALKTWDFEPNVENIEIMVKTDG